ncbi:Clp protease N-terminal domain-containing protein [Streptomyces sp. NEAU-Y11]|uniref:Clp protease N-terminal domain-containing protein n=1 Tax=Streptomyces cucumeris TaxID=2962890 RepID=UPI0020C8CC6A|nr:Clp protease N-terminal domain-containing protein [Streptomyces sp. NEAU-Y11]MCP9207278.1 peptidase [Streptomyces sp. NEAU-Y11]
MFERFTGSAREVVHGAVQHAQRAGSPTVGEPELLLALLDRTGSPAATVLAGLGAHRRRASIERSLAEVRRRGGLSDADTEALAGLGIDVGEIVARVEEAHGVGALAATGPGARFGLRRSGRGGRRPFAPEAKSVLERSLRIAVGRGDRSIGDEHLLLALLARPGVAAHVLADHEVTYVRAERALDVRPEAS